MIISYYLFDVFVIVFLTHLMLKYVNLKEGVLVGVILLLVTLNVYLLLWFSCTVQTACFAVVCALIVAVRMPGELNKRLDLAIGKQRFKLFALSSFTVFSLLYFYLPVTTFLTSPDEIKIHLTFLVENNLKNAMVFIYLSIVFYMVSFFPYFKTALTFIGVHLLMVLFVYSYILPFGYPMMSGLMFEQIPIGTQTLALRACGDVTLLSLLAVATYRVLKRYPQRVVQGILILNVSLMAVAFIKVSGFKSAYEGEEQVALIQTRPIKLTATGNNVLVVFLDRFMGGFIEKILEEEPGLERKLSGFVWYPRTISSGTNSISGVHAMFGGYDYMPLEMNGRDEELVKLSNESFQILPYNFNENGYIINMINPRGLGFTMLGDCNVVDSEWINCSHVSAGISINMAKKYDMPTNFLVQSSYADLMVLLGVMRAVPYSIKDILSKRGPWKPFLDHSAGTTFREWSELKALPRLTELQLNDVNQFNVFTSILPHEPYFIGADGKPTKSVTNFSVEEFEGEGFDSSFAYQHFLAAKSTLSLVADYFDWMRENGVYDNTKILIVSDHGIVGNVTDQSPRAVEGRTTESLFVSFRPLVLIKDRNSNEPFKTSEEFMPNAAAPQLLCQEIGGCINPFLNDKPIKAFGRDDPFYSVVTPWQFTLQNRKSFVVKQLFEIRNKDPLNIENWRELDIKDELNIHVNH